MLKPEEQIIGRRNFMKAAAVIPAVGAYVATAKIAEPVKIAQIGTGGQGRVLLENADYSFQNVVAIADIRPDFRELGAHVIETKQGERPRVYDNYKDMLSDGGFDAVVVATPLSSHSSITLDCLNAGYPVLCEKTMAYTTEECESMIQAAQRGGLPLAIGHQRHANPLYKQAKRWMEISEEFPEDDPGNVLGNVHHIRSLWHRNHSWRRNPRQEFNNQYLTELWGVSPLEGTAKVKGVDAEKFKEMIDRGEVSEEEEFSLYFKFLQTIDKNFDWAKWGFETPDQLGNWRLYKKHSHGLMSELGSHQIDVCNWFWGAEPDYVMGTGGIFKYEDGREVDDHVFAIFRYPNDRVMTFSSITTNKFDHYYDQIMGTNGTVYLTGEKEAQLYSEGGRRTTTIDTEKMAKGKAAASASGSRGADMAGGMVSEGGVSELENPFMAYTEELRMFCNAVRKKDPTLVGCDGVSGYKAAIAVLRANEAMEENQVKSCKIESSLV